MLKRINLIKFGEEIQSKKFNSSFFFNDADFKLVSASRFKVIDFTKKDAAVIRKRIARDLEFLKS